ncbi:MAG: DNA repair protein RadA [Alphaproteobacteria bacterium]|nr:DNA repair protein RadA [Alphaproteobacteria bacterium]
MARNATRYVCQQCGASHPKWSGRCEACGAWNTLVEEVVQSSRGLKGDKGHAISFDDLQARGEDPKRTESGIAEFDRVCGGGLVEGSVLLVGGDPGIGKSTLLLQVVAALARRGHRCAYISGEEASAQVRLRGQRLGLADAPIALAAATSVRDIAATMASEKPPAVLIIDSIQTMYLDTLESAPGTVAQVRASALELIQLAKRRGVILVLVGHVTKDGQLAGPRVLEHMVDTVLYFEGERSHHFRILRAVKNRFGPTDEIGVFEMTDRGLMEVANPSSLFLGSRDRSISGAAVFAGVEGTRPLLIEIQALVAPSSLATPRRTAVGWDSGRLSMILAVLDARCGLAFAGRDVYLNVAGGLRVQEPAVDLAVAAALTSSMANQPVPADSIVFGEIGLSGEVRMVSLAELRLKEAAKLGFSRAIVPKGLRTPSPGVTVTEISRLSDLVDLIEPGERRAPARGWK